MFGHRDFWTHWEGWCVVCNQKWRIASAVSPWRSLNRACSVAWPLFSAFGLPLPVAVHLNSYFYVSSAQVHRMVMRSHKSRLQSLEWITIPNATYRTTWLWRLTLLRARRASSGMDDSVRAGWGRWHILFDVIYTFLAPNLEVNPLGDHAHHQETSWELFAHGNRLWLWDSQRGEWFYIDEPRNGWQRYTWVTSFPITASTTLFWWHNETRSRWFLEPKDGR